MADSPTTSPSRNDRIAASVAHLGVLVPYIGITLPLIIYITQRKESRFVEHQSLQALLHQLGITIFPYFVIFIYFVLVLVPAMVIGYWEESIPPRIYSIVAPPISFMLVDSGWVGLAMGILILAMVILAIVGGVRAYKGIEFRYPITSRIVDVMARRQA